MDVSLGSCGELEEGTMHDAIFAARIPMTLPERRMRGVTARFQVIPESDTLSVDLKNVHLNCEAKVHEYSQRVTYNVYNFWFYSVLCAHNVVSTSAV